MRGVNTLLRLINTWKKNWLFQTQQDSYLYTCDSKCNLNELVLNVPCKQAQKAGRGVTTVGHSDWHYNSDIVLGLLPSTPQVASIHRDTIKETSFRSHQLSEGRTGTQNKSTWVSTTSVYTRLLCNWSVSVLNLLHLFTIYSISKIYWSPERLGLSIRAKQLIRNT